MPQKQTRKSKFGNQKVFVDGYMFDSKAEARYYEKLRDAGISFLPLAGKYCLMQKLIPVQSGTILSTGEKINPVNYKADFVFYEGSTIVKVVDVKGYQDKESQLKMKMFAKEYGYPVMFAKYDRKNDCFEEMSCFESLRQQNKRARKRQKRKKEKLEVKSDAEG